MDRDTFDRLMIDHLPAALRFAARLVHDPADAEDLMHDALVRAAGAWRGLRDDARFMPWLFTIIVNCFRDRLRRRIAPETAEPNELAARDAGPLAAVVSDELGARVARLVSSLPPRQREILVLVAFEGMSPAQAAEVLGISPENARTTLHLARQRLKQQLAEYLTDVPREP